MTQLLSNRRGYFIGTVRREVEEIINDVKTIYGTKSAIVHGGKNKLLLNEIGQLYALQDVCRGC